MVNFPFSTIYVLIDYDQIDYIEDLYNQKISVLEGIIKVIQYETITIFLLR